MKKILFFAPFGTFSVHHQLDAVLAMALHQRGHEVEVVCCDGIYSTCDVLAWVGADKAEACRNCAAHSRSFFSKLKLPVRQLRDFLTPDDFESARRWSRELNVDSYSNATYEGKPVGAWALSSVFSHFRITSASLHKPEVRAVHQGYLVNALLTWIALSRLMDRFPADAMAVFNGRMAPYRVAFEVARERQVRVLGHERGLEPGSFTLYENASCCEPKPVFDYIERWMQVPLTSADCERCSAVTKRQTGAHMNFPGFYDYGTEAAEVRRALNIPVAARTLGVFTSSEFELANNSAYTSVTSQIDYIDTLISVFRGRPDDYLVVRHHPNIAGDAGVAADWDFLRRAREQARFLPANVRIIMPSEKLSSYGLIPQLAGAIAFFSSTGMESVSRGVASAALPESYSRDAATFIIDDTSTQGFARLVDGLFEKTASFQASDLRSCYRYLSASLSRHSSKFNAFGIKDFFSHDIRVQDEEELLPGHDQELDRTCEFLLSGTPIFNMPGNAETQRDTAVEDAFYQAEWQRLSEARAQMSRQDSVAPCNLAALPVAVVTVGSGSPGTPAWCAQSRHRTLVPRGHADAASASWRGVLETLKERLGAVEEEYVIVAGEAFEYDASFVRTALKALEADKTAGGVRIGAWVVKADGAIDGELGTVQYPCRDFHEACRTLPALHSHPEMALSRCLFRRGTLVECLDQVVASMGREDCAAHFFNTVGGPSFIELLQPMAMIRQAALPSAATLGTSLETPVLFLIFNRPDLTQQVFEAIRQQRPRQLFVAADGPRRQVPGERDLCEITRRFVLERIDWACEVKTLLRSDNHGCKQAVSSAISWFFDHVEAGIILEDDCLPDPSFFTFCGELLRQYRDVEEVMQIGGVNFQQGRWRGEGSFYFSKYAHIWGWATWRRAWKNYDVNMPGLDEFLASDRCKALWSDPREAAYWPPILKQLRDGKIDTWDTQWTYTVWKHGGRVILPQVNLVSNLGFRNDGTHTTVGTNWASMSAQSAGKLELPDQLSCDEAADAFTFNTVFLPPETNLHAKSNPATAKGAARAVKHMERTVAEIAAFKSSLAWRLFGKPCYSLEKRIRRLLGS